MHLDAGVDAFVAHGRSANAWSDRSVEHYRLLLGLVVGHLRSMGCLRWADVGPGDVDAVMQALAKRGLAKSTRIQTAMLIKRLFAWLRNQGLILRNPARGLPVPDNGEEDLLAEPLSEREVQALLDEMPRETVLQLRDVALLELLYGCGLRISEALGLQISDIDLVQRTVLVRDSKHGQSRVVPLPRTAKAAVEDYLALRRTLLRGPDLGVLILSWKGNPMSRMSAQHIFRRLNRDRGPEARRLHAHLFRHSIAVHLLRGGADVRYIQAFLGHASLDTTKVYLRLVPGQLRGDYDGAMPVVGICAPHS